MTEKITIEVVKPTSKIRNKSGEKNWKNPKSEKLHIYDLKSSQVHNYHYHEILL